MKAEGRIKNAVNGRSQRSVERYPDHELRAADPPRVHIPGAVHVHHVVARKEHRDAAPREGGEDYKKNKKRNSLEARKGAGHFAPQPPPPGVSMRNLAFLC